MPEHEVTRTVDSVESSGVTTGFEVMEVVPEPQTPCDPFFGPFLGALRENLTHGSSEFGLALTLFSLIVSTRSRAILEIGRNRGYSTLACAGALRFLEMGWNEPTHNKMRPDVDYEKFETSKPGMVWSVDCVPRPEAEALIEQHGLTKYVTYVNRYSDEVESSVQFDVVLIDGDHTFQGCLADTAKFVTKYLKPGGYFILHDYFGWYVNGKSCSPIMQVIQKCLGDFDQVLIDTGYQSFVVFRKQTIQMPVYTKVNSTSEETIVAGPVELTVDTELEKVKLDASLFAEKWHTVPAVEKHGN